MRTFGLNRMGGKHSDSIAYAMPEKKAAKEYVWELDVGPRTISDLMQASGLSRATLNARLNRGCRKWEALVKPAATQAEVRKAGGALLSALRKNQAHKDRLISRDKREYYAKMREGHKKL